MNGCNKNLIVIKRLIRGVYAFIKILKAQKLAKHGV